MISLNALIIDDEPLAHNVILEYAKDIPFLEITSQCYKATEAYTLLNTKEINLIFLDIQMPKLRGLDFLRTLQRKPQVIITSAFEEYALEGFELQVCDYLLKPFGFERFMKGVNKAHRQLSSAQLEKAMPATDVGASLFVKVDKKLMQIQLAEIQYLESYGNYVKVWTGATYFLTPRTLTSFEKELPLSDFIRIHKSYIIQKTYIDYLEGHRMMMRNGQPIPIGKNHRQEVKQWLG